MCCADNYQYIFGKLQILGRKIIPFATSGSSEFENALSNLRNRLNGQAMFGEGIIVHDGIQKKRHMGRVNCEARNVRRG